jgi:hypothetical protein
MRHTAVIKIGALSLFVLIALSPARIFASPASVEGKEYSFVWSSESDLKWYDTKQQEKSSGTIVVKFMDGNYSVGEQVIIELVDSSTSSWYDYQNLTISENMFQLVHTTFDWENQTYLSGVFTDFSYLIYLPDTGVHVNNNLLLPVYNAGATINDRTDQDDYPNFYALIFTFTEYYLYDGELNSREVKHEVSAEIDDDGVLLSYNVYITKKDNNSSNESTQSFTIRRRNKLESLLGIISSVGLVNLFFYGFFAIVIIYTSVDHLIKRKAVEQTEAISDKTEAKAEKTEAKK